MRGYRPKTCKRCREKCERMRNLRKAENAICDTINDEPQPHNDRSGSPDLFPVTKAVNFTDLTNVSILPFVKVLGHDYNIQIHNISDEKNTYPPVLALVLHIEGQRQKPKFRKVYVLPQKTERVEGQLNVEEELKKPDLTEPEIWSCAARIPIDMANGICTIEIDWKELGTKMKFPNSPIRVRVEQNDIKGGHILKTVYYVPTEQKLLERIFASSTGLKPNLEDIEARLQIKSNTSGQAKENNECNNDLCESEEELFEYCNANLLGSEKFENSSKTNFMQKHEAVLEGEDDSDAEADELDDEKIVNDIFQDCDLSQDFLRFFKYEKQKSVYALFLPPQVKLVHEPEQPPTLSKKEKQERRQELMVKRHNQIQLHLQEHQEKEMKGMLEGTQRHVLNHQIYLQQQKLRNEHVKKAQAQVEASLQKQHDDTPLTLNEDDKNRNFFGRKDSPKVPNDIREALAADLNFGFVIENPSVYIALPRDEIQKNCKNTFLRAFDEWSSILFRAITAQTVPVIFAPPPGTYLMPPSLPDCSFLPPAKQILKDVNSLSEAVKKASTPPNQRASRENSRPSNSENFLEFLSQWTASGVPVSKPECSAEQLQKLENSGIISSCRFCEEIIIFGGLFNCANSWLLGHKVPIFDYAKKMFLAYGVSQKVVDNACQRPIPVLIDCVERRIQLSWSEFDGMQYYNLDLQDYLERLFVNHLRSAFGTHTPTGELFDESRLGNPTARIERLALNFDYDWCEHLWSLLRSAKNEKSAIMFPICDFLIFLTTRGMVYNKQQIFSEQQTYFDRANRTKLGHRFAQLTKEMKQNLKFPQLTKVSAPKSCSKQEAPAATATASSSSSSSHCNQVVSPTLSGASPLEKPQSATAPKVATSDTTKNENGKAPSLPNDPTKKKPAQGVNQNTPNMDVQSLTSALNKISSSEVLDNWNKMASEVYAEVVNSFPTVTMGTMSLSSYQTVANSPSFLQNQCTVSGLSPAETAAAAAAAAAALAATSPPWVTPPAPACMHHHPPPPGIHGEPIRVSHQPNHTNVPPPPPPPPPPGLRSQGKPSCQQENHTCQQDCCCMQQACTCMPQGKPVGQQGSTSTQQGKPPAGLSVNTNNTSNGSKANCNNKSHNKEADPNSVTTSSTTQSCVKSPKNPATEPDATTKAEIEHGRDIVSTHLKVLFREFSFCWAKVKDYSSKLLISFLEALKRFDTCHYYVQQNLMIMKPLHEICMFTTFHENVSMKFKKKIRSEDPAVVSEIAKFFDGYFAQLRKCYVTESIIRVRAKYAEEQFKNVFKAGYDSILCCLQRLISALPKKDNPKVDGDTGDVMMEATQFAVDQLLVFYDSMDRAHKFGRHFTYPPDGSDNENSGFSKKETTYMDQVIHETCRIVLDQFKHLAQKRREQTPPEQVDGPKYPIQKFVKQTYQIMIDRKSEILEEFSSRVNEVADEEKQLIAEVENIVSVWEVIKKGAKELSVQEFLDMLAKCTLSQKIIDVRKKHAVLCENILPRQVMGFQEFLCGNLIFDTIFHFVLHAELTRGYAMQCIIKEFQPLMYSARLRQTGLLSELRVWLQSACRQLCCALVECYDKELSDWIEAKVVLRKQIDLLEFELRESGEFSVEEGLSGTAKKKKKQRQRNSEAKKAKRNKKNAGKQKQQEEEDAEDEEEEDEPELDDDEAENEGESQMTTPSASKISLEEDFDQLSTLSKSDQLAYDRQQQQDAKKQQTREKSPPKGKASKQKQKQQQKVQPQAKDQQRKQVLKQEPDPQSNLPKEHLQNHEQEQLASEQQKERQRQEQLAKQHEQEKARVEQERKQQEERLVKQREQLKIRLEQERQRQEELLEKKRQEERLQQEKLQKEREEQERQRQEELLARQRQQELQKRQRQEQVQRRRQEKIQRHQQQEQERLQRREQEKARQEQLKQEQIRKEQLRQEQLRQEQLRQEQVRQEKLRQQQQQQLEAERERQIQAAIREEAQRNVARRMQEVSPPNAPQLASKQSTPRSWKAQGRQKSGPHEQPPGYENSPASERTVPASAYASSPQFASPASYLTPYSKEGFTPGARQRDLELEQEQGQTQTHLNGLEGEKRLEYSDYEECTSGLFLSPDVPPPLQKPSDLKTNASLTSHPPLAGAAAAAAAGYRPVAQPQFPGNPGQNQSSRFWSGGPTPRAGNFGAVGTPPRAAIFGAADQAANAGFTAGHAPNIGLAEQAARPLNLSQAFASNFCSDDPVASQSRSRRDSGTTQQYFEDALRHAPACTPEYIIARSLNLIPSRPGAQINLQEATAKAIESWNHMFSSKPYDPYANLAPPFREAMYREKAVREAAARNSQMFIARARMEYGRVPAISAEGRQCETVDQLNSAGTIQNQNDYQVLATAAIAACERMHQIIVESQPQNSQLSQAQLNSSLLCHLSESVQAARAQRERMALPCAGTPYAFYSIPEDAVRNQPPFFSTFSQPQPQPPNTHNYNPQDPNNHHSNRNNNSRNWG